MGSPTGDPHDQGSLGELFSSPHSWHHSLSYLDCFYLSLFLLHVLILDLYLFYHHLFLYHYLWGWESFHFSSCCCCSCFCFCVFYPWMSSYFFLGSHPSSSSHILLCCTLAGNPCSHSHGLDTSYYLYLWSPFSACPLRICGVSSPLSTPLETLYEI